MIESMKVFSILDERKISMLMDVIDESIVKNPSHDRVLESIRDVGFTQVQANDIAECFFNFYSALRHPDKLKEQISNTDMKAEVKQLITETFEQILEEGDKDMVAMMEEAEGLAMFGHNHLHEFSAVSEFRPIIDNHKLQKMVVSVVVAGRVYESNSSPPTLINFQMRLGEFENLVHMLDKRLDHIKMEVRTLEEKLGEDIVST